MIKNSIIAITGPTATGKTQLAIKLATEINGEIISVDSRQIYKELDIATAKPTLIERNKIRHHLIDIVNVTQEYTVADFCDDAKVKIKEIIEKGKVPILTGGTGLYFRVLLQDFDLPRVAPNKELRDKLNNQSTEELYDLLLKLDKDIAQKIHFNNKVKIIRALEVCITLGIPMSQAQRKKEKEYETLWYGLTSDNRDFLYNRANKRVDIMLDEGLINEAKLLFNKYDNNNILLNTIGYQEIYPYLHGSISLDEAISNLKQNTRRYIKRQISWFKANKEIHWIDIEKNSKEQVFAKIISNMNNCKE